MNEAIRYDNLDRVIELFEDPSLDQYDRQFLSQKSIYYWALEKAVYYEKVRIVKYLCENGSEVHEMIIARSAYTGNLDLVKYFFERKSPIDTKAIKYASQQK